MNQPPKPKKTEDELFYEHLAENAGSNPAAQNGLYVSKDYSEYAKEFNKQIQNNRKG